MIDCTRINIDRDLHYQLNNIADPCRHISQMTQGMHIVERSVSQVSSFEKILLRELSKQMLTGYAPKLFPFLYASFVCDNTLKMVFKPTEGSLTKHSNVAWWVNVLFQIAKAVEHLEGMSINHNGLDPDNVKFQLYSENPNHVAVVLTNFDRIGGQFYVGKDLNFFLYTLIYGPIGLPQELTEKLKGLIIYKRLQQYPNENNFQFGIRQTTIDIHNEKTSGRNLSTLLRVWYPTLF